MLLDPHRILGWGMFTYILMIAVAILALVLGYQKKKQKWTNSCVLVLLLALIVLSEIVLSFPLGGTDLFFLEWMAYFGELLLFLPIFVGYLLGFLIRLVALSHKHTNQKEAQTP